MLPPLELELVMRMGSKAASSDLLSLSLPAGKRGGVGEEDDCDCKDESLMRSNGDGAQSRFFSYP